METEKVLLPEHFILFIVPFGFQALFYCIRGVFMID